MKIDYRCSKCGADNCKLWRQSHTFASMVNLLCATCVSRDRGFDFKPTESDCIGDLVPAVPTEDGETFWGYTSVPQAQCNWWWSLPPHQREPVPIDPGPTLQDQRLKEDDENVAAWTKKAVFCVEATDFEKQALWTTWALEGAEFGRKNDRRVKWKQLNPGCSAKIGMVNRFPVCVSVTFARIAGSIVVFYCATSRFVDRHMVERWVHEEFGELCEADSAGGPPAGMTDAGNFHLCIDECVRLSGAVARPR